MGPCWTCRHITASGEPKGCLIRTCWWHPRNPGVCSRQSWIWAPTRSNTMSFVSNPRPGSFRVVGPHSKDCKPGVGFSKFLSAAAMEHIDFCNLCLHTGFVRNDIGSLLEPLVAKLKEWPITVRSMAVYSTWPSPRSSGFQKQCAKILDDFCFGLLILMWSSGTRWRSM